MADGTLTAVWKSVLGLLACFLGAAALIYWVSTNTLSFLSDAQELRYPSSLSELQTLVLALRQHVDNHFPAILLVFCLSYLFKQSFAIPGSALLNVFAGAIFGLPLGFPLVCFLTASGASCCFLLSLCFGKPILEKYFPGKMQAMRATMEENEPGLFFFLISVRLLPVTPNWLINMVAPLARVPLGKFFLSVLIGLMPYNFLCVQGGLVVSQLESVSDLFSFRILLALMSMAAVSVLPGFLIKKRSTKVKDS